MADPSRILNDLRNTHSTDNKDLSGQGGLGYDRVRFEGREIDLNELVEQIYRLMRDELRYDRLRSGR